MQAPAATYFQLLQLPEAALNLVLQKLDQYSLACTAVTCNKLRHAVPAATSTVALLHSTPEAIASFSMWLGRHNTSLANLVQCRISASPYCSTQHLYQLAIPHLHSLHLQDFQVQFQPADGSPGVLHDCSNLTALELRDCETLPSAKDSGAAFAAIAALPELRSLTLASAWGVPEGKTPFAQLAQLTQLTFLSLEVPGECREVRHAVQLSHLSALVNLQHLELTHLQHAGVPGGLPSQLVKLTRLRIVFHDICNCPELLQHLSSLTALQSVTLHRPKDGRRSFTEDLAIEADGPLLFNQQFMEERDLTARDLGGIQNLSQLTCLQLQIPSLEFDTSTTEKWARLTALESLALTLAEVEPLALEYFTRLRARTLIQVNPKPGRSPTEDDYDAPQNLLEALAQLSQLTELCFAESGMQAYCCPPGAYTALTASAHLRALRLRLGQKYQPHPVVCNGTLFPEGAVFPHLRTIDLHMNPEPWLEWFPTSRIHMCDSSDWTLDTQTLALLCSCCPAVVSLAFAMEPGQLILQPLLQLSALTSLQINQEDARNGIHGPSQRALATAAGVAATAEVVGAVAQLTGLKQLVLGGMPWVSNPVLLQLTALTALEELLLSTWLLGTPMKARDVLELRSKARDPNPPDVLTQLLRHLLRDPACCQAVLSCSPAAAAAPAECSLAQLAATLAESLLAIQAEGVVDEVVDD